MIRVIASVISWVLMARKSLVAGADAVAVAVEVASSTAERLCRVLEYSGLVGQFVPGPWGRPSNSNWGAYSNLHRSH